MIEVRTVGLGSVLEIVPKRFGDDRGFFCETYHEARFIEAGIALRFVQDNQSYSAEPGVLRGLHYQLPSCAQDKLLRVVTGAIFDVAVDIRRGSLTFGNWVSLEVSARKWNQILIPKGFAHGFVTLEPHTQVIYKVTDFYSPEHERSIRFDDPAIGIDWPIASNDVQLSEKDRDAPLLADADIFD